MTGLQRSKHAYAKFVWAKFATAKLVCHGSSNDYPLYYVCLIN